jgi:hypothetical protein
MKLLLLLAVAAVLAFPVRAAETWPLKLTFPRHVGQTYGLESTLERQQTITLIQGDQPLSEERTDMGLAFAGQIEVLAVNAQGQPKEIRLTIKNLRRTTVGKKWDLLAPGDIVTGQWEEGAARFYQNGEPLPDAPQEALQEFSLLEEDAAVSDDELFGTDKKVAPGDTWPVNREQLARSLSSESMPLTSDEVSGTVSVTDARVVNGHMTLTVITELQLNYPKTELPHAQMSVEAGKLELTATSRVPVGTDDGPLEQTTFSDVTFSSTARKDNGTYQFETRISETHTAHYTFPSKRPPVY